MPRKDRRGYRRQLPCLALLGAFSLILSACSPDMGGEDGEGGSAAEQTLTVASVQTPPTLDPEFFVGTPQSWEIANNIYDAKVYYETDRETGERDFTSFESRLVESWDTNADGTVWTFQLRQGVKNHLDHEMTAKDWEWSWDRTLALNGVGAFMGAQMNMTESDSVEVIDDYTVRYNLSAFSPHVLHISTFPWIPLFDSEEVKQHATEDDPWAEDWVARNAIGYGAYYLEESEPGRQIVLKANPNYYRGEPELKTIVYREVPESANRVALLARGDVDIALDLSPEELTGLEGTSDVSVSAFPDTATYILGVIMNNNEPPLDDPKVRQALSYLAPYDEVVNDVFAGFAVPVRSYLPPVFPGYTDEFWPYTTDVDRGVRLLEEAGVDLPLSLTIHYAEFTPAHERAAIALRSAFAEVDIDLQLERVTPARFSELSIDRKGYQLLMPATLQSQIIAPLYGLEVFLGETACCNWSNTVNEELFALFDEARSEEDSDRRLELIREIQRVLVDDPPWISLAARQWVVAHQEDVKGVMWAPMESLWFDELRKE